MQNTSKLPGVKSIQCLLCSKVTINVGNMKQHFEVHHYRRTYSCDVCNKTCKTKNCLFVHKKTYGHNTSTQPKLWSRFSWITFLALINKLFRWTWLWRICESKLSQTSWQPPDAVSSLQQDHHSHWQYEATLWSEPLP